MNVQIKQTIEKVKRHIDELNPDRVVCMYSGGNDSSTLTHLMMESGIADTVLFLDTGIGIPETKDHVIWWCHEMGYPLHIQKTPESYEDMIMGRVIGVPAGFPGPPMHWIYQNRLKDRALDGFKRETKTFWREKYLLLTGIRKNESIKRMGYDNPASKSKLFYWYNPLFLWTKPDCIKYLRANNVKTNPVSNILGMSGECLCGAYAHPGELEMIEQFYPETAVYIKGLEKRVKDAGYPWGWEQKQPKWFTEWKQGQSMIPGLGPEINSPLCNNCNKRHEEEHNQSPVS